MPGKTGQVGFACKHIGMNVLSNKAYSKEPSTRPFKECAAVLTEVVKRDRIVNQLMKALPLLNNSINLNLPSPFNPSLPLNVVKIKYDR